MVLMEGQGEYCAYGGTRRILCLWRDKENIVLMEGQGEYGAYGSDKENIVLMEGQVEYCAYGKRWR